MGSYTSLKETIESAIYENSVGAVTGIVMQTMLSTIVDSVGLNANFMGMLSSNNLPSTTDGKQFYLAITPGTYNLSNVGLGSLVVGTGDLYIVYSDSTGWHLTNLTSALNTAISTINTRSVNAEASALELQKTHCLTDGVRVVAPSVGEYAIIDGTAFFIYNATDDLMGDGASGMVAVTSANAEVCILFPDTYGLPTGETIPGSSFIVSSVTSVTFPASLKSIGDAAFQGNENITSMTFHGAVPPSMGADCFGGMSSLAVVYVPACSLDTYTTLLSAAGVASDIIQTIESTY